MNGECKKKSYYCVSWRLIHDRCSMSVGCHYSAYLALYIHAKPTVLAPCSAFEIDRQNPHCQGTKKNSPPPDTISPLLSCLSCILCRLQGKTRSPVAHRDRRVAQRSDSSSAELIRINYQFRQSKGCENLQRPSSYREGRPTLGKNTVRPRRPRARALSAIIRIH